MTRLISVFAALALLLTACGPPEATSVDGPRVYKIRKIDEGRIENGTIESINVSRAAAGMGPLTKNAQLTRAAEAHAGDMARQNRPWHWGSDGSSPEQRAYRAGFAGKWLGETLSETYEDEKITLNAWLNDPGSREVIMDASATQVGFGWFQERGGKIWWVLETGR